MAFKSQYFLLAAFILAIGALEGSASAGANLAPGETRLPSGVVVRIDDAPSSAEELKRRIVETFGTTPEDMKEAIEVLRSAISADSFRHKLAIIDALNYPIQYICDEYITYAFKPYHRTLPSSLKEVVADVYNQQSGRSEGRCVYKVAEGPNITRQDGFPLPNISFEKVQLDDDNNAYVASISETNEIDKPLPIKEILIIVPFATTDLLDLGQHLTHAAQKLYDAPAYKGTIIRFVTAEKRGPEDTYKSLGLEVWAFRTVSGGIVFVDSLRLRRRNKFPEFIEISTWRLGLRKALAAGVNSKIFEEYNSNDLIRDSIELLDTVGRHAAKVYKASKIVILNQATAPGSNFILRHPVAFELDNGIWRLANKRK